MLNKNDFVELDFTGRIKDNGIFDTSIKENAREAGLDEKKCRPLKICIGQKMIVKGFDLALEGKELNKKYQIELNPEDAFGKRESNLVKTVPVKLFIEKGVMPRAGMLYSFDSILAKIISVSGGRVMVDFNNPLAGRNIIYEFIIKRKIDDLKEKISITAEFILRIENQKIELQDKKATLIFEKKIPEEFFNILKKKVKELLDVDISFKIEEKKEEEKKKED